MRRLRIPSPRSASMTSATAETRPAPEAPVSASQRPTRRVLVFTVAGRTRCCDIGDVREIVPITPTTRLPGAPPHVRGLINLRGTLVTVLDAALCLYGVPAVETEASILLVERNGRVAGVMVDNVFDMQSLLEDEVQGGALIDLRAMVETALA